MIEPEGLFREVAAPRARRLAVLPGPVVVRKLWRGRGRSTAICVSLLTIENRNVVDVRLWRMNSAGRMAAAEGFTLDIHRAPELAAALAAAHRRAVELQLIDHRGPER